MLGFWHLFSLEDVDHTFLKIDIGFFPFAKIAFKNITYFYFKICSLERFVWKKFVLEVLEDNNEKYSSPNNSYFAYFSISGEDHSITTLRILVYRMKRHTSLIMYAKYINLLSFSYSFFWFSEIEINLKATSLRKCLPNNLVKPLDLSMDSKLNRIGFCV